MAFTLSRIDRVPRKYTITAADEEGNPVTLVSIDFAVSLRRDVDEDTIWTTVPVTGGQATVVLAGYEATAQAGDLVVPRGQPWLHQKWVDGSYVDANRVERITAT